MKVLITGKGGQLALELEQSAPSEFDVLCVGRSELDITNDIQVLNYITQFSPDIVINAAAYTAVDKAEVEIERAYAVNELGVRYLAQACKAIGARMLHVSTDFVFDGQTSFPYKPDSKVNPINTYGASKLAGEQALKAVLPDSSVIVRTSWVYSFYGSNFVKTMLHLMQSKPQLNVVCDQVGTPTWAKGLANWLWVIAGKDDIQGVYHWTDAGVASWYDFAVAVQELGIEAGLLNKSIPIFPISTINYPTPARRPAFSVMDKTSAEAISDLNVVHWRKQLTEMMSQFQLLKQNLDKLK